MKYVLPALICSVLASPLSVQAVADESVGAVSASDSATDMAADKASWELEKEDEELGIRIYTRDIKGSDLKEFRGETRIKSNLTGPIALIEDVSQASQWMHNCSAVDIIENVVPGEAVSYVVTEAPWPVSDRDSVVHTKTTQDADSKVVRVDVNIRNNVFPVNEDFVRITSMKGFWSFTPAADGYLDVVYQIHAEPNGALPSWLANSVVVDTPYYTLKNMQKLVGKEQYQTTELSFVKN